MTYSATQNSDEIIFEILGQISNPTNSYVAVGFSNDQKMGQDTVTACASYNDSPFLGRLTFNQGKTNLNTPVDESSILRTLINEVENNIVYCQLAQKIIPPSNVPANYVGPLNQRYFILMASGRTRTGENPGLKKHNRTPYVSPKKVDLMQFNE